MFAFLLSTVVTLCMTGAPGNATPIIAHIITIAAQVITLLYYLASYFPGGAAGVRYIVSGMGQGAFSLGGAAARAMFSR